jgi:hypothetical protein
MNEYSHRENPDGSFDSICMTCFITAGNAPNEDALTVIENEHICSIAPLSIRNKNLADNPSPKD